MKKFRTVVLLIAAVILVACNKGLPTAAPTQDISGELDAARTQAVQTFQAEQASQASPTPLPPTPTLAPSATEVPSPTTVPTLAPTNTLAALPTNTSPAVVLVTRTPVQLDCSVTDLSPAYLTEFAPREDIDAKWSVKNTGSKTWGSTDIDLAYISGEKMSKFGDSFDIGKDVAAGSSIDLIVDMLAPALPGNYTTTWGLKSGSTTLCTFSITIRVK
jgi:hypothetical protein